MRQMFNLHNIISKDDNMKKRWMSWWTATIMWTILFVVGTVFVWTREIDGAGAVQTPEAKLTAFIVLLIAFIFPFIIQIVWLIVNMKKSSNK